MQALDLSQLDLNWHRYDKRDIVASCLYIEVGLFYNVFSRQQISMTPDVQTLLITIEQQPHRQNFSQLMQHFIMSYFGKDLSEIMPAFQFIARFFGLDPSTQDFPIIIKQQKKSVRVPNLNSLFKIDYRNRKKNSIPTKLILKEDQNMSST